MLRAQVLQSTPSGTYYNQSIGQFTNVILEENDIDGDGFCAQEDCDDMNPAINSNAVEIPENGIDDNCNDYIDEVDEDNDGYHNFIDCDDQNAMINPDAVEIPNNGIDENCDSEDQISDECFYNFNSGIDELTYEIAFIDCSDLPFKNSLGGVYPNTAFSTIFPPSGTAFNINYCDGYDENNWQGLINIYYYSHFDNVPKVGDLIKSESGCNLDFIFESQGSYFGFIVEIKDANDCSFPINMVPNGFLEFNCISADSDNDGYNFDEDCDDDNANINPDQSEEPYNGIDDDCNTATPDDDLDQDGFLLDDDCDDNNANINPNAVDVPNNGIDEDCDGMDLLSTTHQIANTSVSIYPNPATDVIHIDVLGQLNYEVKLYNLKGQLISTFGKSDRIAVTSIIAGTYILEVQDLDSGQKAFERIVIGK